jgi:membrane-bound lytic murein transglycosylase B
MAHSPNFAPFGEREPSVRSTASSQSLSRRAALTAIGGTVATLFAPGAVRADIAFERWVDAFRSKAVGRGISDDTYTNVMRGVVPDTTGLTAIRNQPEFNQQLWQYLNRAASDWRIAAGKAKAKENAALFARIDRDFGVEPSFMLGVWGLESAFGDPIVEKTICGRSSPPWQLSPGPNRAAAAIGKAN